MKEETDCGEKRKTNHFLLAERRGDDDGNEEREAKQQHINQMGIESGDY